MEVTQGNRKVYIGWAINPDPGSNSVSRSHLTILPLFSGYRHHETMELCITSDYAATLHDERFTLEEWNKLGVVINLSDVVSLRLFDIDLFQKFRNASASPFIAENN